MLLKDKVALVTGAGSLNGIGWAIAKRFAEEGAKIVLVDIAADKLQIAADTLGLPHQGFVCDVRDSKRCKRVVEQAVEAFGQIDILINNAGVSQPRRLLEIDDEGYDLVMGVSLRGALNMSKAVVPHMRQAGSGNILCMGSVSAQRGGGVMGGAHYSAAKGGVQTLAKALARELAPDGIRVNAVAPGLIETDLIAGRLSDENRKLTLDATPLGRIGQPVEVANACLYLVSDMASYVTGVVLDVNGGLHIH
ncbi:SDR family NAD(P)-dependent oxidoreductase [Pseudomonas tolaasii]|uniref:SDR family NAD(P)-dependent oxidoreductase n=1 Tax=Pseudomonas tolaasii TaxID=29442 RepID=UPI001C5CD68C|nr:SDR family NAD(P)-dependent oxidoreductase [Pseudomonas tolaasii]MBW4793269.1 SDR family oxidoreductase [Pseudomonas tolaasii]